MFFKMNPRISPRKPDGTRCNRIISFNNFAVQKYFDNMDLFMEKCKVVESTVLKVRGADKSLTRPGRKQANVSVRMV